MLRGISILFGISVLITTHLRADFQAEITSAVSAARGLELLQKIPQDELFNRFCKLNYDEQEADDYQLRIQRCKDAVSLIEQRLTLMSSDLNYDMVDIQFFNQLNAILTGSTGNMRGMFETNLVSFGSATSMRESSFKEVMAFGDDMEAKFDTGMFAIEPDCFGPVKKNIMYFLQWALENVYEIIGTSPIYAVDVQRHINCRVDFEDLKVFLQNPDYNVLLAASYERSPYLLNSHNEHYLKKIPYFRVIGMDMEVLPDFLEYQFTVINSVINKQELIGARRAELELAGVMRFIFFAHPFTDGNTRTFTVMLNMIRLLLGIPPQSQLLNVREYSSREIVEGI